jgi:hypothetical protein
MKCMICSRPTLPGNRLCKPCRSALRRARDDTISELMPLPRRLNALAWQQTRTMGGQVTIVDVSASTPRRRVLGWIDGARRRAAESPLQTAGVAVIAVTVGVLAFVGTRQLHIEGHASARRDSPVAQGRVDQPGVSPATLAAAARQELLATEGDPGIEAPRGAESPPNTRIRSERARATRPMAQPAPPSTAAEAPLSAFGPVDPQRAAAEVAPAPPPVASAPRLDRWQSLSMALARCAGEDPWERSACEHSARFRYCDGYWGQVPLCPTGVANDHGQ